MEWMSIVLAVISIGLLYLIFRNKSENKPGLQKKRLDPFPKGDLTLNELRDYNGNNADGRVLLAINREIFDCTRGSRFYGPEGPYAALAGRDATRALATFNVEAVKEDWDDYADLSLDQMNGVVAEWLEQFKEKYDYVGKLVKTEADKSPPVD